MSKLSVHDTYRGVTLRQCMDLHASDAFLRAVATAGNTRRRLLGQQRLPGGGFELRARYDLVRDVGGWRRLLPTPDIAYVETTRHLSPTRAEWRIEVLTPSDLRGHLHGHGTIDFRQQGDDVVRHVQGEIRLDPETPKLGRLAPLRHAAEQTICAMTKRSLHQAARQAPSWVRLHGVPSPQVLGATVGVAGGPPAVP